MQPSVSARRTSGAKPYRTSDRGQPVRSNRSLRSDQRLEPLVIPQAREVLVARGLLLHPRAQLERLRERRDRLVLLARHRVGAREVVVVDRAVLAGGDGLAVGLDGRFILLGAELRPRDQREQRRVIPAQLARTRRTRERGLVALLAQLTRG